MIIFRIFRESFLNYYYNLLTAEVYNIQLPIYGARYKNILKIGWGQKSRRHYKLVYTLIFGAFSAAAHIYRFLELRRRDKEKKKSRIQKKTKNVIKAKRQITISVRCCDFYMLAYCRLNTGGNSPILAATGPAGRRDFPPVDSAGA